jgi:two-component system response regulator AtoC
MTPVSASLNDTRAELEPQTGSTLPLAGSSQRPVVLIESDPAIQRLFGELLEELGCAIVSCATGEEGLRKVRELRPELVLIDVGLPDQDGLRVLERIRAAGEDLSIIMLSTNGRASTIVKAMKRGANDFLIKPFSREEARRAIEGGIEEVNYRSALETERLRTQLDQLKLQGDQAERDRIFRHSAKMRAIRGVIDQVADTDVTVLIWGESGVGKDLIARAIHTRSFRRDMPFVKVNCAALPLELLESELFGYERGAFTGAYRGKPGKFELANKGTIFLDEIGEMPLPLQAKLLQVLQDRQFSRLGSRGDIRVDVRVVASTNKNLAKAMEEKTFREDLYYRLNIVNIFVPPLRERREEVPIIVDYLWRKYSGQYNRHTQGISAETLRLFLDYYWPGNVRELENMVKRIVILKSEELVKGELAAVMNENGASGDRPGGGEPKNLEGGGREGLKEVTKQLVQEAERAMIKKTLESTRWNRVEAARRLKISYKALLNKIQAYGLTKRDAEDSSDA